MRVTLPADPNSDNWISFHRSGKGRFTLAETCAFRLPEDAADDDRVWDAAGINLFPKELEVALACGDLNEHKSAFIDSRSPEEEAKAFEAHAARAAPAQASGKPNCGPESRLNREDDRDILQEEYAKIAQVWREIAANKVTEASLKLVRTRMSMTSAWTLLADRLLEDSEHRAVERIEQDVQRLLRAMAKGNGEIGDCRRRRENVAGRPV